MKSLSDIERLTKDYSDARSVLVDRVNVVNDEVEKLKRRAIPGIKSAVATVKEMESVLKAAIEDGSSLFVKPRSVVFHGVKVGIEKSKGKLIFDNADQVIKLIKKHYPEQADVLIKTTEKPSKKNILGLSVSDLKKIGCEIKDSGDVVIVKPVDSNVDKLVSALLGENVSVEDNVE